MAKKKTTHQSAHDNHPTQMSQSENHDKDQTFTQTKPVSRQSSMEDPAEKLQNLKSLNSLLLKESFERRQQVESLVQAKEALESELARSGDERKELELEMGEESEKNVGLELEKGLIFVYVETQMEEIRVCVDGLVKEKGEKEKEVVFLKGEVKGVMDNLQREKGRLNQVLGERDLARSNLDVQVKEAKGLKERLTEMENKERKVEGEIVKLKGEYEKLMRQKERLENVAKEVVKERDLMRENLKDSENEVEGLKKKIEEIVKEKKEFEEEKKLLSVKIGELESEMEKQKGVVMSLRKEEEELRTKVLELENSYGEALEREAGRAIEIAALVEEKGVMEKSIEKLMEEKNVISQSLEKLMVESDDKQRKLERLRVENDEMEKALEMNVKQIKEGEQKIIQLLVEKNEVESEKVSFEGENVELKREMSQLKNEVSVLKESCNDIEEKNSSLDSEVNRRGEALDRVSIEKDEVLKRLAEEEENKAKLESEVLDKERRIKKIAEELAKIGREKESLVEENEEMESRLKLLSTEKGGLEEALLVAKKNANDLRAKLDSTTINYERALSVLKDTASLVCQSPIYNDRDAKQEIAEETLENGIEPCSAELEAIKRAFRDKETMVEDTKREVEFMRNSMAEAEKRKSFWTIVSSATTIFAAVSLAYAVKPR